MEAFTVLTGRAQALAAADVDTDIIYPARFLLVTEKRGLGQYAFADWRAAGRFEPDDAPILVAGPGFGTGSSREQAVWALRDLGIRAVIAPSFGEIFFGNCFANGVLPVRMGGADYAALLADAEAGLDLTVDLEACEVRRRDGPRIGFDVPGWRREALLAGWDEVDTIMNRSGAKIAAFETAQRASQPWLWSNG